MYVITGATGNTGNVAARMLLADGQKVRVIGRSAETLQPLQAFGAEPFVCDLTNTESLTKAFTGAREVYAMVPPAMTNEDYRAHQDRISDSIAAAVEAAGVEYAVSLSSMGADKNEKTGPVVGQHYLEQRFNQIKGLNILHLRPGYFMENTLSQIGVIKAMGMAAGPLLPNLKLQMTATRDIGTAAAGSDYLAASGTITFNEGETSKTFTVQIINDAEAEANETFNVTLSGVSSDAVLGSLSTATVTILDDDSPVFVSVNDISINEADAGTSLAVFTVSLSRASGSVVSINYATADGSATAADRDYEPASGTLIFNPGETSKIILVLVNNDTRDEETENFFLNLSSPSNASLREPADAQATATIVDNDPATAGELLISEFRTSGPAGVSDEFVELYNNTDAPLEIRNYVLRRRRGQSTITTTFTGSSIVIPARGHLLIVGETYSLSSYAARTFLFSPDAFAENDGLEVRRVASNVRIDTIGFTDDPAEFREGAGLAGITLPATNVPQYSFVRRVFNGRPQDTDNNALDFTLVSTTGEQFGNVRSVLGAPGPENIASPTSLNFNSQAITINGGKSRGATNTRLRRRGRSSSENVAAGALVLRRTFVNTSGRAITRLRFRVVDISTLGASGADVRVLSSSGSEANGQRILGLTLESPATQPPGGGLNASLSVDAVTSSAPLAPDARVEVEFRFDVQRAGRFYFVFIAEALP